MERHRWTGWTAGDLKRAVAAVPTEEVDLDGARGVVLPLAESRRLMIVPVLGSDRVVLGAPGARPPPVSK